MAVGFSRKSLLRYGPVWGLLQPAIASCVLTCICLEGGNLGNRDLARTLAGIRHLA